jgi:hypothetical protein
VRIALGASPGLVRILIFRQGFAAVIFGMFIGMGLTTILLRVLRGITPEVGSNGATPFIVAIGLVARPRQPPVGCPRAARPKSTQWWH